MNKTILICVSLICLLESNLCAQTQTVGTFLNNTEAFEGYNLLAPTGSDYTYLVDNCGQVINQWESEYRIGLSAYILEDGSLLRTAKLSSYATPPFSGGGTGGRVERYSWEGELIWSMNWADTLQHQHHDIEWMPNGNLLILGWEKHSYAEALEMGKTPNETENDVWCTQITEIQPTGNWDGEVVWQWCVWSHLVQDTDESLPNYAEISNEPKRFNINYSANNGVNGLNPDWMHSNSIAYNESLDQIMISAAKFNEIFIVDHSTTTTEAMGPAGDLMWRYGNPMVYERGTIEDRTLFFQHNAHWIDEGLPGEGNVLVYNNGRNRPGIEASSVEEITLPEMANGTYPIEDAQPFSPETYSWRYPEILDEEFYSSNVSGAERQPNGNTLIANGQNGFAFEINPEEEIVFRYVNPITAFGATTQGNDPGNNAIFRFPRYASDYSGFQGKDMTPGEVLEANSWITGCDSEIIDLERSYREAYPNPFTDFTTIHFTEKGIWHVYSTSGLLLEMGGVKRGETVKIGSQLNAGFYIVKFSPKFTHHSFSKRIVKL